MTVTVAQATSLLETVLFESPTLAATNASIWVAQSASNASESTVSGLAAAMAATPEAGIEQQVIRYYEAALGRTPGGAEIAYYVHLVEAPLTASQVAQGASAVTQGVWDSIASGFTGSSEFQTDFSIPASGTVTTANQNAVIGALYQNILGRTPAASESAYYVAQFSGGLTVTTLMQEFSNSPEYQGAENAKLATQLAAYGTIVTNNPTGTPPATISTTVTTPAAATYALSHDSQASVTEGGTETFSLATTGVATGTPLYYTLTGVTASEVAGGHLTGSISVDSHGTATLSVTLTSGAGQGLTGNLTATLSVTAGGTSVASASEPLEETAAYSIVSINIPTGASITYLNPAIININAAGQTAGEYADSAGNLYGYVSSSGGLTTFSLPSNATAGGYSLVNDSGQVAGEYVINGSSHSYFYSNGSLISIDSLAPHATTTSIWGMNNSGQVVGSFGLYSNGIVTSLPFSAYAINDAGEVAGYSGNSIYVYESGGTTSYTLQTGESLSSIAGISQTGQVSGTYYDLKNHLHAFTYDNGNFTPISLSVDTIAVGMNSSGEVFGYYENTGSYPEVITGFVYQDGTITSINAPDESLFSVIDGVNASGEAIGYTRNWGYVYDNGEITLLDNKIIPGAVKSSVRGINNSGQISGEYTDSNGVTHAFVATPTATHASAPTAESYTVAVIGIAAETNHQTTT